MTRLASMDVGTNSVLLLVAELDPQGGVEVIDDRSEITRLGEGLLESGEIGPEGAERTTTAISKLKAIATGHGVDDVVAVGTMCLRSARNASAFIDRVAEESAVRIRVIPGEEEARLTYEGLRSDLPIQAERLTVFDLGGGSTEFIVGTGDVIEDRFSLELGVVTLTERFLTGDPVSPDQLQALLDFLDGGALADLSRLPARDGLAAVGGSVTTMAAVHLGLATYDRNRVHGLILTNKEVRLQMLRYLTSTMDQRAKLAGMEPKRADVILAGSAVVHTVLEKLGAAELVVSDRGLRHGLLRELAASAD